MRDRWLLRHGWGQLETPLRHGLWVYQRNLLRRALLALRASVNVRSAQLSHYWLQWRLRQPLER